MNDTALHVAISMIDEERFGIRTARSSGVTRENLAQLEDFCAGNDVKLSIARCATSDIRAAQSLETEGYLLMDTLVYFARNLQKIPIPSDHGEAVVRPLKQGENEPVRAMAAESFKGYFGHYHADERLDRAKCDEAYTSWAHRSCVSKEVADEVLVAEYGGELIGFATLRMNDPDEGEGVLFGVAKKAQGRGVYRSFMVRGMEWCLSKGATRMVVSTQVTNLAVQKVWVRVGFEPSHSYYTFHKWFD